MRRFLIAAAAATILLAVGETGLANTTTYTVKPGDSLWRISTVYHTSVQDLESVNHLHSDVLQIGQKLTVPALSGSHETVHSSSTSSSSAASSTYTVESGDTLWGIATQYGESVSQLERDNGVVSDTIQIGQKLRVRGSNSHSSGSALAASRGDSFSSIVQQASSSTGQEAVQDAKACLGTPYVWGGTSPSGFDCSGFVRYVMEKVGVTLPHSSYEQVGAGRYVSRSDLEPGDLVFFDTGDGISHVGIYAGGGIFIHADSSRGVTETSLNDPYYWSARYVTARRVL